MSPPFRHVAVLGTGLIGGSFALALRRAFPEMVVTGWDRTAVLDRAVRLGAIHQAAPDLASACRSAELVYVALPVEEAIRRLPEIVAAVSAEALTTDAASTKSAICEAAARFFQPPKLFVGGHPIAGRELAGVEHADADLFRGAPYVLIGESGRPVEPDERVTRLVAAIEAIGARPVWLDAAEHDRLFAFLSHLPQLTAVALAETVLEGAGDSAATLAGRGLVDSLRLAGSPYDLWAGICRTSPSLDEALARLIRALERIRTGLAGEHDLARDFDRANRLYKTLRRIE
jgi:prephenate dehydrogenase